MYKQNKEQKRSIVFVSGMLGAGLSTALHVFEDLGYEAVDNLRLSLIEKLVDESGPQKPLAISVDVRGALFSAEALLDVFKKLALRDGLSVKILYLECSDDVLQQRFTATRRRHPLALDRPLTDGIKSERDVLFPVRAQADLVVNTSSFSVHDLRRVLSGHFQQEQGQTLSIFVMSFSYRMGLPREADLVFDVRFLANPHWDEALRALTGQQQTVAAYIKKDIDYQSFMSNLSQLVLPLLPRYQQEGKSYLTLAIGCSGGRHRSVLVAEECATLLAKEGYNVSVAHRDMQRLQEKD